MNIGQLKIGRLTINFAEIKKLLVAALGFLGYFLNSTVGIFPAEWRPVVNGVITFLALVGVFKVSGPTGLPVIQRSTGRHAAE